MGSGCYLFTCGAGSSAVRLKDPVEGARGALVIFEVRRIRAAPPGRNPNLGFSQVVIAEILRGWLVMRAALRSGSSAVPGWGPGAQPTRLVYIIAS